MSLGYPGMPESPSFSNEYYKKKGAREAADKAIADVRRPELKEAAHKALVSAFGEAGAVAVRYFISLADGYGDSDNEVVYWAKKYDDALARETVLDGAGKTVPRNMPKLV